jgi:hypothetical protein
VVELEAGIVKDKKVAEGGPVEELL